LDKCDKESGQGSFKKNGGYFQVPDLVFDLPLTANEKLVLIYFMRRADRKGRSFPSVERICRDCGFKSENTARKVVRKLVKDGLVQVKPVPGRSHNYFVSRELYRVIQDAKAKHGKNGNASSNESAKLRLYFKNETLKQVQGDGIGGRVKKTSPTHSKCEVPPSNNEVPPLQNMNPKEYTVEPGTEKEYTVNKAARKKKKRALEEAGASSSLTSPVDDNKVTLLDVAEHLHSLSYEERREFDREALKLQKPGEPDPHKNLWQKRLLRVRHLQKLRDGGDVV
jgi:hypothetical protein